VRLVVHIGSHKAGSTSIQEYCRANQERLHAGGIHYPTGAFPRYPGQHSELNGLVQQDRMDEVRGFLAAAAQAARAQGAGTVFLSGEDLCTLGPGLAHRFQVAAATAFARTEVVLVLRNKRDYLYSSYKHLLLHGGVTGEHDFVARQVFSPRRAVAAWRQLPDVEVQVLPFDAMKRDLLGEFFRRIFGLEVRARIEANRSLDYLTLQAVNALLKPAEGGPIDAAALALVLRIRARHPAPAALPVEDVIADTLDRRFADEEWDIPGVDFAPSLLERRQMAGVADPVALSAEMAELYSALQTYFAGKNRG
jgi:hypothetical protein